MKTKHCFTLILLTALAVFGLAGCKGDKNRASAPAYVRDSITFDGNIIRSFGRDSVWVLDRDSTLSEVTYPDSLRVFLYDGERKVHRRIWSIDSLGTDRFGNTVHYAEYHEEYFRGGRLKMSCYQGTVGGCGASVGRTNNYDEEGCLLKTEDFIYPAKAVETKDSLRFLSYVVVSDFYPNGRPKSRKLYRNYNYYDTDTPYDDEEGRKRLGLWEFYDEAGNIAWFEQYGRFNEQTGGNIPFKEPQVWNARTKSAVFALNDSISVRLREIPRGEYDAREEATAHLRGKPYEVVRDTTEIKKMLRGRVELVAPPDDESWIHGSLKEIEIAFRDGVKRRLGYGATSIGQCFIAYYPELDIVILESEAAGEEIYDLNDSSLIYVGDPNTYAISPDGKWRISGYYPGGAYDREVYWIERWNDANSKYEFAADLEQEIYSEVWHNFLYLEEWYWTDHDTALAPNWHSCYEITIIEK